MSFSFLLFSPETLSLWRWFGYSYWVLHLPQLPPTIRTLACLRMAHHCRFGTSRHAYIWRLWTWGKRGQLYLWLHWGNIKELRTFLTVLQAWIFIMKRAQPFSFFKGHFNWEIITSLRNYTRVTRLRPGQKYIGTIKGAPWPIWLR